MSTVFQHRIATSISKGFAARFAAILLAAIATTISISDSIHRSASAGGLAAGLRGEYFDNEDFSNLKLTRTDAAVDFNLSFGTPDPLINSDTFSIRWTGQITIPLAGSYRFVTRSDDGVRLWLGDQLLIDNFTPHPETEDRSAPITLNSGQSYNLRLEYFERTAIAVIRLMWIRPGQTNPEVIPSTALSTPTNANPAPTLTSISPTAVAANRGAFTLTVQGSNFLPGVVVQWNNAARPTTLVNSAQLTASIPASDLQSIGVVNINAVNPLPGGGTSNRLPLTVSGGYEADVAPRPNGTNNGVITITDWTQLGRFSSGMDIAGNGSEFQRADCAPRATLGNGSITMTDWVQAGRYVSALDPVTVAGGPTSPNANAASEPSDSNDESVPNPPVNLFGASLKGLLGPRDSRAVYAIARPDNSIAIACSSLGGENAFGFSVKFDPRQWQFVSAASGADARDAAIFVNARQIANGRVGVAMALPPNHKFPAGARQIAVLTFRPRSGNIPPSSPAIEFSDSPVAREVVDVNAKRLRASFAFDAGHRVIALRRPRN
ncbi:MAG: PA14 domain-containing protein [Blastocatellia bacterium]